MPYKSSVKSYQLSRLILVCRSLDLCSVFYFFWEKAHVVLFVRIIDCDSHVLEAGTSRLRMIRLLGDKNSSALWNSQKTQASRDDGMP
jgi:hypothetical protein